MNHEEHGCRNFIFWTMLIVLFIAACVAFLFILWLNGGLNYASAPGHTPSVCPATFDASMILITQQRQTVVCIYRNDVLFSEQIEERRR
jgi:hypothetical protein